MRVLALKAAWGIESDDLEQWLDRVKQSGYDGIELNPIGHSHDVLERLKVKLQALSLEVVIQAMSSWDNYTGPRPEGLGPADHLKHYRERLILAKTFSPILINVQSGSQSEKTVIYAYILSDLWTVEESISFYKQAMKIDEDLGLGGVVCHETHRNRSCWNLAVTTRIIREVPQLQLTGDISHWVLVGERLLNVNPTDVKMLSEVVTNIRYLHCRVGTTQSSQCPEPDHPSFQLEKEFFYAFWREVVDKHRSHGALSWFAFVPEYGPFPYQPLFSPKTNSQVADTEAVRLRAVLAR